MKDDGDTHEQPDVKTRKRKAKNTLTLQWSQKVFAPVVEIDIFEPKVHSMKILFGIKISTCA